MKRELKIAAAGIVMLIVVGMTSCNIEKKMQQDEEDQIRHFIAMNNITVQPTATGLYYLETQTGTGNAPIATDTVGVYYKMKLLTGVTLDDQTTGEPFKFVLGDTDLIKGFREGISYMKVGGKANIVVPSSLAWGKFGYGYYVGPYTAVYFELDLQYIIPGTPGK